MKHAGRPLRTRQLDDEPHPVQIELLSKMSPVERVALWNDLTRTTLEMAYAGLQHDYPEAEHDELKKRFAALVYGPELAEEVYGPLL